MIQKEQYKEWREKYISNSRPTDFTIDCKEMKTKFSFKRKEVVFMSLTPEDYFIWDGWNKKTF